MCLRTLLRKMFPLVELRLSSCGRGAAQHCARSRRLWPSSFLLQVERQTPCDKWSVWRRYSDFRDLYEKLPSSVAAITPPLPPKSWRSISILSMTPVSASRKSVLQSVLLCLRLPNHMPALMQQIVCCFGTMTSAILVARSAFCCLVQVTPSHGCFLDLGSRQQDVQRRS